MKEETINGVTYITIGYEKQPSVDFILWLNVIVGLFLAIILYYVSRLL